MSPLVLYLFRNFTERPFVRTLVVTTMLVVAATFCGVASIAVSLRSAFSFQGHENRVMVTERGARSEKESNIDPSLLNAITVSPEIKRRSPEALTFSMVAAEGTVTIVQLRGLEPQGFEMHDMKLVTGRMPEPGAAECLIGDVLLEAVPSFKIGNQLELLGVNMTVVGTFHAEGFLSGEAWTTRQFYTTDPRRKSLASVFLETSTPDEARALAQRLGADKVLRVNAVSEAAYYKGQTGAFDHIVFGLTAVLFLVSLGSVLASISLIALLQQRAVPELCVLRAIGFRSAAVSLLILFETELLTLFGGALGVFLTGLALRKYVVYTLSTSLTPLIVRAPLKPVIALAALAGMFVVGVLGALRPILRMRHVDIAVGLREE
ncbi:MAG: ABC transporter permease [Polyangia bacterium]